MNPFKGYTKKLQAIQQAEATVAARREAEKDAMLTSQLVKLEALKPTDALIAASQTPATAAPRAAAPTRNYVPYIAAGVGLAALAIFMGMRR